MENEIDQTQTEQVQESVTGQETAQESLGQVEADSSGPEPEVDTKRRNSYFAEKRIINKLQEKYDDLEEKYNQLATRQNLPVQQQSPEQELDPYSDLPNYLKKRDASLVQQVFSLVDERESLRTRQANLAKANALIESQESLREDDFDELETIVKDNGLKRIAEENPDKAVKLAMLIFEHEKGLLNKPKTNGAKPSKAQAAGVQGSSSATGKKIFSKEEMEKLAAYDPQKFSGVSEEYLIAIKEGRVR